MRPRLKWFTMTRLLTVLLCVAAAVGMSGCDDARTFVKESKEGYRELEVIAGKLGEIAAAIKTNDFAQAKEFAGKVEPFLKTRVLSWTVQILAIEEKEGVAGARSAIERLKVTEGITAGERLALDKMEAFYRDKTGRTGDLLVIIGAVAVEQKYGGHYAGAVFAQICQELRTSVATNAPNPTNALKTP